MGKKKEEAIGGNEISEMVVDEIVDAEETDVVQETTEMALDLPEPVITSLTDKPVLPEMNFDVIKKEAEKYVSIYKDMVLTEDNVDSFIETKNKFVAMRTTMEKARKTWIDKYIKPVKDYVDTKTKDVVATLAIAEENFKVQLVEYDQRRIDDLNEIFGEYVTMARKKFEIKEEDVILVDYKKQFYNKGAKEKETRDDIFQQVADWKKTNDAKIADYELIKTMCKQFDMVDAPYITQYDLGANVSSVCLSITGAHNTTIAIAKAKELADAKALEDTAEEEVIVPTKADKGFSICSASKKPTKEETKSIKLEFLVTKEQVGKLNKFIKEEGIKVKVL